MKKVIIKILILIILITLLVIPIGISSRAEEDVNSYDAKVEISSSSSGKLKAGDELELYIKILKINSPVGFLTGVLTYDENIFEKASADNFVAENGWEVIDYSDDSYHVFMLSNSKSTTEAGKVMTVKLKVKDSVTSEIESSLAKIEDIEIAGDGIDLTAEVTYEKDIVKEDDLYLKSQDYKIGNDDIHTYIEGDKYISRIDSKTTVKDFISKLDTNADKVEVLKEDGSEAKEDEYVGTGMTLKATKEDKDVKTIQVKIAVIGDLTGDGLVTATDLSVLKQTILNNLELTEEYIIAADIDESGKISATDLSEEVRIVLQ